MKYGLPVLAFFLLSAQIFGAGDFGGDSLRSFCMLLLNVSANATQNSTVTEIAAPPSIKTRSSGYYGAVAALASANQSIAAMADAGLPIARANDAYVAAVQWLEGQSALEEIGSRADYGFVLDNAEQIARLESTAFALRDDFKILGSRLGNATQGSNLTSALELRDSALSEFRDERFEEAKSLMEQSYAEISSAETAAVHSQTLVESTRKNVETFLRDNWQAIAGVFVAIGVLFFIFQKRIRRFVVSARINSLMHEKEVIQSMLRELQRDYFEKNGVTEMTYHVKTKKFGDLIRNINRQLPLMKEELKRI